MRAQASSLFASVILFLAVVCLRAEGQNLFPAHPRNYLAKTFTLPYGGKPYVDQRDVAAQVEQALRLRQNLNVQDLNSAIQLFEQSAKQYRRSGRALKAAEAEREAGDTYLMMGSYRLALDAYQLALNLPAGEKEARCTILAHMARTFANMGDMKQAQDYSRIAMGDIPKAQNHSRAQPVCPMGTFNPKVQADILEARGETYFWGGDWQNAVRPLGQARDLYVSAGDHDGEALSLLMLANAKIGSTDDSYREEAPQHVWEALKLWTAAENRYGIARAQAVIAFIAVTAGQFDLAQCNSEQALSVFRPMGDKDDEAIVLNIQGRWAREIGDAQTSLDYYRKALATFATVEDRDGEIEAITGLNTVWMDLGHYQKLPALYEQKLRLVQQADHVALAASGLMDRAGIHQGQRQYDEAEKLYRQALKKYRSAKHAYGEGDALMRLAYLFIAQGHDGQAITFLKNARQLKEKTGQIEAVAKIRYELARIYRRRGRLEEARTEILEAIQIIESQRLRLSTPDSRAQYFASVHQYYSLFIQVLMALDKLHPQQGWMQLAFEASERSKARSLLDLLENSDQSSSCSALLEKQLASPPAVNALSNESADDAGPAPTLGLQQIQANLLEGDTVLVEYALGDNASYAWVVDQKKITAYALPPEEKISRLAQEFRKDLLPQEPRTNELATEFARRESAAKQGQEWRAQKLARVLIGKLPLRPGQRILITPDGPLQYIPFSALPLPGRERQGMFLLEQHQIIPVPSASALAAMRQRPRVPATAGIAVFADPVFEPGQKPSSAAHGPAVKQTENERVLTRARHDMHASQSIDPLPGSRKEAESIQQIFGPGSTFLALGFDANRNAALDGRLSAFRIVHFATHGIIDVRHPEMSGLILSLVNAKGERQDGYLLLGDIYKLRLSADLVVLSSCESALGKELQAEGIIGLPRGFLHAGAKSVIASLWKVDDAASAILMKELYTRMRRGERPSAALRDAQLALISANNQYSNPYYWAAFVLEGDYK